MPRPRTSGPGRHPPGCGPDWFRPNRWSARPASGPPLIVRLTGAGEREHAAGDEQADHRADRPGRDERPLDGDGPMIQPGDERDHQHDRPGQGQDRPGQAPHQRRISRPPPPVRPREDRHFTELPTRTRTDTPDDAQAVAVAGRVGRVSVDAVGCRSASGMPAAWRLAPSTVNAVELGVQGPSAVLLLRLATALRVPWVALTEPAQEDAERLLREAGAAHGCRGSDRCLLRLIVLRAALEVRRGREPGRAGLRWDDGGEPMEVAAMSTGAERDDAGRFGRVRESLDEQARRKGAKPLRSLDELRFDGIWESDEELDELLDHLDRQRQAARQLPPPTTSSTTPTSPRSPSGSACRPR